ncbi:MAG: 3'-5' exonuclease, partial [Bacillota bacterium]|nr:3'-5' exonuclease [Bacillota bacterium]
MNNLYLITGDDYYYECLNNLNKVRISTIHKYVKYVLEEIAFYIGYQKNIKITSNAYDRKLLINKYYDDYENITKFLDLYESNPIKTYEIEKIIKEISNQIKQKNISVSDTRNKYELESNKNDSFNFIISILDLMIRVESDVEKKNYENNKIELSNLIMELSKTMDDDTKSFTKLKNKLEYLFVDEFQDTDDLQIELLLALQKIFGFKLFIVGDVKQCIYRFRGAEDQAFNKILEKIKFKRHYLRYNYRSEKSLIESINKISTILGNKKLLNFKHNNDSLIPYFNNYEAKIFIKEFSSIHEQTSLVIDYITKTVAKSSIDNISILVRYNKEASMWKKIIEEAGFLVNSETNNNFYNTTPIIEFFKLVQALMHSRSKVYILQLFTTDYIEGSYNINILEEVNSSNIYELIPWWVETIKKLKNYPVMRVIHELIYEIKPWNYYGLNFNKNIRKEKTEYYKKTLELLFENLIFSHDTDYMTLEQIEDFLKVKILTRYSDEVSEKISNEMYNDLKIDVLTVHKAKGLEFDSVIIPNMSYEISTESKNTKVNLVYKKSDDCNEIGFKLRFNNGISISTPIFDRLIEKEEDFIAREEARLFYVAMTRAKKELALFRKNYEQSNITW